MADAASVVSQEGLLRDSWRGRPYLLSPVLDFLLSGGGALIALLLLLLFMPVIKETQEQVIHVGIFMGLLTWMAYFINYPHFMTSYQLLYHRLDRRLQALRANRELWWRTLNAAVFVPLLLLALTAWAVYVTSQGDTVWVGITLQVMLFFVGWHYSKQAFGVFFMLSALKGIFYTTPQRRVLVFNAYAVWLCSWVYLSYTSQHLGIAFQQGFVGTRDALFSYNFVEVPDSIRIPLLVISGMSTLLALTVMARQWRVTGMRPSITGIAGYFSMYYLWAFVALLHPEWAMVAPLFHSAQYLLFVIAYKRGEYQTRLRGLPAPPDAGADRHAKRLRSRAQEFFAWSFVLGILAFNVFPTKLESLLIAMQENSVPEGLMVLLFLVFINVHHYFIDNVLWRRENKEVGEYLIRWRQAGRRSQ